MGFSPAVKRPGHKPNRLPHVMVTLNKIVLIVT
jgi:hypothetical protein